MSTATPHIRAVLDARFDITGTETINDSTNAGWTTRIVQFFQGYGFSGTNSYNYGYSLFIDSSGDFPFQDAILLLGNPISQAYYLGGNPTVGLKHYQHQMQAMKGYGGGMAGDNGSSPPSGDAGAVDAVYQGNGTYKQQDISMGEMRGIEYSTTFNGAWPSSNGTAEHLPSTGEISVGNAAV
tara:strand:+ start:4327 stop:4872 length:546 start_codon:yes stop_codon:yes gene_type:complete